MSQDYTIDSYKSDHVAQVDLANMEKNLECLRSSFSGASAPSNAVAGHFWFDTAQTLLKIRNNANNQWLGVMTGTTSQKIWIYRNDSDDGWTIDGTVTDRVLSLKGGTGLYNANGGTNAGESWSNLKAHVHSGAAHTHSHNHQWYRENGTLDDDQSYDSDGDNYDFDSFWGDAKANASSRFIAITGDIVTQPVGDAYTNLDATAASSANTGAQSTADVRPAAAIGTLQYLDI